MSTPGTEIDKTPQKETSKTTEPKTQGQLDVELKQAQYERRQMALEEEVAMLKAQLEKTTDSKQKISQKSAQK